MYNTFNCYRVANVIVKYVIVNIIFLIGLVWNIDQYFRSPVHIFYRSSQTSNNIVKRQNVHYIRLKFLCRLQIALKFVLIITYHELIQTLIYWI